MTKLGFWKELWSVTPAATFMLAGMVVSVHDFLHLHEKTLQSLAPVGALLFVLGAVLELSVRLQLIQRAGFSGFSQTKRLLITDQHSLITDGVFAHIRHPLYLGRITLDFGFALFFSSFWGAVLMTVSAVLFLVRIQIEEEMLVTEFGDAYHEYRQQTKKLIPFVY